VKTQLVQLICAFRMLAPDVELSLSTRESPVLPRSYDSSVAINTVSAGSKTQPGGYADDVILSWSNSRRMMAVHRSRLRKQLTRPGLQPVWKDWDGYLGRGAQ
jgi:2-iminoacetate synthase